MEPRNYTLTDLFDGNLVYVVPNYQRLYVWSREDQWEPLWSDVREIAEGLIDGAQGEAISDDGDRDETDTHFLGAAVFKMSGSTPDLARRLRVIDGQQRLTTLQLLMAAAGTTLRVSGREAPVLHRLTTNESENEPFKIQYQRHKRGHDYERFPDVMRAGADGANESLNIEGPMAECYRYFTETIEEWLAEQGSHADIAGNALARTLAFKLRVVAIYLDPHEKEHAIFESLNARGEPLTEWDKIKNYLLYKADEHMGINQDSFFEQYLDGFDDPWWRELVGRGVQRPRADVFVDYWLEAQTGQPVAVRRVFRAFQNYVDTQSETLEEIMTYLVDDADYYRRSETLETGAQTREELFHARRGEMGAGAVWPLILKIKSLDLDEGDEEACFVLLESYLVRRLIAGYQARSYDQVALDLVLLLSEDADSTRASETIRSRLRSYSESGTVWPKRTATTQGVLQRSLPLYARRLVLAAVEKSLITTMAGKADPQPGLHVEHLMPQGWQPESWPLPTDADGTQAVERREQAIHSLGNQTLLNGPLNQSISNSAWAVKREAIEESDNLFLNRRLLKDSGDEWTETDIEERGRWMAGIIMKIWPRRVRRAPR